jgi:hypothetical protein
VIRAQAKRRDIALLRQIDRHPGQRFGILVERFFGGDRPLVARSGRTPVRISALAFLELHAWSPVVGPTMPLRCMASFGVVFASFAEARTVPRLRWRAGDSAETCKVEWASLKTHNLVPP